MERCHRCEEPAAFICPDCGTKSCQRHMEPRYTGPDRGFKSRLMCPACWKKKRVVLNQDMVKADQYKPKTYVFSSGKGRS